MIRTALRRLAPAVATAAVLAGAALSMAPAAGAAVPHFLSDPRVPTTITAFASPPGSLTLTATLTTQAGVPLAGETVTFTTQGAARLLCTEVTDVSGFASCSISGAERTIIRTQAGGVWFSRFAGDVTFQPTSRAGHE